MHRRGDGRPEGRDYAKVGKELRRGYTKTGATRLQFGRGARKTEVNSSVTDCFT